MGDRAAVRGEAVTAAGVGRGAVEGRAGCVEDDVVGALVLLSAAAPGEDEEDERSNACLELNVLTRNEVRHVGEDEVLPSPHHTYDG